jgi:hypothetical protein
MSATDDFVSIVVVGCLSPGHRVHELGVRRAFAQLWGASSDRYQPIWSPLRSTP